VPACTPAIDARTITDAPMMLLFFISFSFFCCWTRYKDAHSRYEDADKFASRSLIKHSANGA